MTRAFLASAFALLWIVCNPPPPVIEPPPPSEIDVLENENFNAGIGTWRKAANSRNTVAVSGGNLNIQSPQNVSGWVYSRTYPMDKLRRFTLRGWPSHDFAIGITPAPVDTNNSDGMYSAGSLLRFAVWRDSLWSIITKDGRMTQRKLSRALRIIAPIGLTMEFANDSVAMIYEQGTQRLKVGMESIAHLAHSNVSFVLAAHKTTPDKIARIDSLGVIVKKRIAAGDTVFLHWNPNIEGDLKGYLVEQSEPTFLLRREVVAPPLRAVVFDSATFRVFAQDTSGNVSAPSLPVGHRNRVPARERQRYE